MEAEESFAMARIRDEGAVARTTAPHVIIYDRTLFISVD